MLNLPSKLASLDEPVRVGVVGAGLFGSNLVTQMEHVPGLRTAAIADVATEKAVAAYERAGVDGDAIAVVDGRDAADAAMADGKRVVLGDGNDLASADVDVLVEATGVPSVGARHAFNALMAGTHVVMVTVEADTVVGPFLTELAERNGVTYSMAYGDQPALIVELVDWARTAGFEVVAAGKGVPFRESFHHGTPDDIFERMGFEASFVEERNLNARMYNSFADGTKVAVEMCAVANATGLGPDVPRMHLPTAEIPEIPGTLRPKSDGGILDSTGVVDTVSSLYPDGSSVPEDRDISFGVFVVTRSPDSHVRQYLSAYAGPGFAVAGDGEYQVFYRPYHLPGLETGISVANAALRNEPTGAPRERVAEVVGAAKRDLSGGEELDGGGGTTVYGVLVDAETADEEGYVPFELLDRATLTGGVARDDIVTEDDVDLDESSFLYRLRRTMDAR
jgi:predicted homoserine dehydrogenase-like protein